MTADAATLTKEEAMALIESASAPGQPLRGA